MLLAEQQSLNQPCVSVCACVGIQETKQGDGTFPVRRKKDDFVVYHCVQDIWSEGEYVTCQNLKKNKQNRQLVLISNASLHID